MTSMPRGRVIFLAATVATGVTLLISDAGAPHFRLTR